MKKNYNNCIISKEIGADYMEAESLAGVYQEIAVLLDVESWGRGFLKIKAECNKINAPLPVIDAKNDGVSITATGCEKYMSLLRYGQYGQVGADGVWRDKEPAKEELKHSSVLIGLDIKEYARIMEYLEIPRSRKEIQEFCGYKSRDSFMKTILNPLIDSKKVNLLYPDKPKSPKQKYFKNKKQG